LTHNWKSFLCFKITSKGALSKYYWSCFCWIFFISTLFYCRLRRRREENKWLKRRAKWTSMTSLEFFNSKISRHKPHHTQFMEIPHLKYKCAVTANN
jgi:hypothetical protein